MGKLHTIQTASPRRAAALCLLAGVAAVSAPGVASHASPDGRSIGLASLNAPLQQGDLQLASQRAYSWSEGATKRLLLEGDVRVEIGRHTFQADRASIWIHNDPNNAANMQIAIYFADVRQHGASAFSGDARRLLVTAGLASPAINLRTDLLTPGRPHDADTKEGNFLRASEERLARYLATLGGQTTTPPSGTPPAPPDPSVPSVPSAGDTPPQPSPRFGARSDNTIPPMVEPIEGPITLPPDTRSWVPATSDAETIAPSRRVVSFSGEPRMLAAQSDGSQIGLITPNETAGQERVVIQYAVPDERTGAWKIMELRAQNAVVFLRREPGASPLRYEMGDVQGVYLEGDVIATDGDYTLRGSRVFFDITSNRGVIVDGVFWTYDEYRGMPIYLRADLIRQTAQNEWHANGATLANVDFAEPHFSIGAESVTVRRRPAPQSTPGVIGVEGVAGSQNDRIYVDARNVGFRTGSLSLLGTPRLAGEVGTSPFRAIQFDSDDGDLVIRTRWDAAAILGLDLPPGNQFHLLLDGYLDRGPAIGTDLNWQSRDITGSLFAYYLYDNGTDHFSSGAETDRNDDSRSIILADNVWRLNNLWTTFAELSYISDPALVNALFEPLGETRREFISGVRARRLTDHTAFNIGVRATLNDFIANEYLLQSKGYQVEKLPEARYAMIGLDALNGLFSYFGQTSVSSMRLAFHETPLRESGFDTLRRARAGFGLLPSARLSDVLEAAGYPERTVNRFDTRHEIELPLKAGPGGAINITPFVVGRLTAYDTDFEEFSGQDDDQVRLWFAGGVRASTSFVNINNSARSQLFDVDRLRHIVEPSLTFWSSGTNIDQSRLPIYDDDVESIADGTVVRAGVRNTWQTQRGPAGRKRSVDWITLSTDFIWSTSEVDEESPYGRFIESEPELSNLGRFFNADLVWHLTDAVSLSSNWLYNTQDGSTARTSIGAIIDHGDGFWSFFEYRDLAEIEATRFNFGAGYELTTKYALTGEFIYDLDDERIQTFQTRITRRFPQWTIEAGFDFDNISDAVGFGIVLRPAGFGAERRLHTFTDFGAGVSGAGSPERLLTPGRFRSGPLADND